ncbi:MAG: hypothetical protein G01um101472_344 [Parcubacteria group bacterium Gr01-1014_72]|nr:MAG: hypothetical protein G01um101472_344 [Parcubacteria group bacterium Gr01-1014_72]
MLHTLITKLQGYFHRGESANAFAYASERNPYRDWNIIIAVFAVLAVLVAGWSFYMYQKISRGEAFVSEKAREAVVESVDKVALREVISEYGERAKRLQELRRAPLPFVDPSRSAR